MKTNNQSTIEEQKSRRGIHWNHNQTAVAESKARRGTKFNHNQTAVAEKTQRGLPHNHNQTILGARPIRRQISKLLFAHPLPLTLLMLAPVVADFMTTCPVQDCGANHNQTLLRASQHN